MPHAVRNLSITIDVPLARAYAFAHRPENFTKWAAGMAKTLHRGADGWVADTPQGEARVTFSAPNDYGVLDHVVALPGKPDIHIPLRLIANGDDATEAVFTLFRQPDMDDAAFDRDEAAVTKDLAALKAVLEG
jgi:hypothetical protein